MLIRNCQAKSRAPTLFPKPIAANLQIGEQVEGATSSSTPDDIDHDTKQKARRQWKNREDVLDQVDAESDPKLKKKKKPPDPNTDPSLAQPTFCTLAVEDAARNGGEPPTIDTSDVVGRAFITTQDSEGEQVHARINEAEFL